MTMDFSCLKEKQNVRTRVRVMVFHGCKFSKFERHKKCE